MLNQVSDVAIIGAGPYGLSLASHLRAACIGYRIFGKPMQFWQDHVAHGTSLKSDGKSSDLIDCAAALSYKTYSQEREQSFSANDPIPVERFVDYGKTFQQRLVPDLDPHDIVSVVRSGELFRLTTADGRVALSRRVVLAVGINAFRFTPPMFAALPAQLLSHSADFGSVAHLAGLKVAVIGSGASAIDIAAVAHESGADTTIVSGRDSIVFHSAPALRKWHHKVRAPDTGIGAGWSHSFYTYGPDVFRLLPSKLRLSIVSRALGPSPGWFMKDRIVGRVPVLSGQTPVRATPEAERVTLQLQGGPLQVDHVVAATGYHVDMKRLGFIDPTLRSAIRTKHGAPVLSANFQSSVPGLYVIGPASAFSFGPVMRFVYGAGFATPRLAGHLVRAVTRRSRPAETTAPAELAPVR